MKKNVRIIIIYLSFLTFIFCGFYIFNKGKDLLQKKESSESCKEKTIVWGKNEYQIPSSNNEERFFLRIDNKNLDTATITFKPLSGEKLQQDFTDCMVGIAKVPVFEEMSPTLKAELQNNSKGVVASVVMQKNGQVVPLAQFVVNLQVFADKKNGNIYDFDSALQHVVDQYSLEKDEHSLLKIDLKELVSNDKYDYEIVEYEGKRIVGSEIELISDDNGQTWKVNVSGQVNKTVQP